MQIIRFCCVCGDDFLAPSGTRPPVVDNCCPSCLRKVRAELGGPTRRKVSDRALRRKVSELTDAALAAGLAKPCASCGNLFSSKRHSDFRHVDGLRPEGRAFIPGGQHDLRNLCPSCRKPFEELEAQLRREEELRGKCWHCRGSGWVSDGPPVTQGDLARAVSGIRRGHPCEFCGGTGRDRPVASSTDKTRREFKKRLGLTIILCIVLIGVAVAVYWLGSEVFS